MQTTIFGYKWTVAQNDFESIRNLPKASSVYILTVRKNGRKRRQIVYIGYSRHLVGRIRSHETLRLFRRNLVGYTIEILHRDFGKFVNRGWERKLIWHYKPPFNGTWEKSRHSERHLFWRKCGVDKVVHVINPYKNK